ncbi:MAG: zinc ABC transporter substrate-binding protein [Elusimicrobia bacterium]|jgi:zinc/manganese transport system substrate-binding protein|nr:zinc ABC transporter substrate-binding protein [Elusimicrobiota bacterium]
MKMIGSVLGIILFALVGFAAPLKVVTTTPDLADLARQVGGDRVKVECLSRGNQDPHFVEAKPSLILKVREADLFIETGLDLEIGWAPSLVQGSRNLKVQRGALGFLDASTLIHPLEIPSTLSRSEGDVHPGGNPHYLGNPRNAIFVIKGMVEKLSALDPPGSPVFATNAKNYIQQLNAKMSDWEKQMESVRGTLFVSYHKNLVYFAEYFGFSPVGEIEPKPGIPPTPRHTADLIALIKGQSVPLILTMTHFERRTPDSLAGATGARVVTIALVPEAVPEARDYISAFDYNVKALLNALEKK